MNQISEQALPEGARVGLYEIKNVMHQGQNTITYRAWSHHLNAQIIVKEYYPQAIVIRSTDGVTVVPANNGELANFKNGLAGFKELAESLIQIEHANIAQTQNCLEFNGTAYMIIDFQEGVALSQRLKDASVFSEAEIFKLFLPLLEALQCVHIESLCHGEIGPENILLKSNGEPVLVSFSVLSVAELYKPYIQPTPTDDLYQLAATLYQCVGKVAPAALSDRIEAVQQGKKDPLELLQNQSDLAYSPGLLESIDNMLSLDQGQRPQTAEAAIATIKASLTEEQAENAGLILADAQSQGTTTKTANPKLWLSMAGSVVLLLVIGFWSLPTDDIQPVSTDTEIDATTEQQQTELPESTALLAESEADVPVRKQALVLLEQEEVKLADPDVETMDGETQISSKVIAAPPTVMLEPTLAATESEPGTETDGANPITNWARGKDLALPDRIQWHLAEAQQNLEALRLTTPLENNAYQHYRIVLVLDPKNAEAKAGMDKIVEYYDGLFTRALAEGRLQRASIYLRRVEAVMPDAPEVKVMREQLIIAKQ